VKQVSKPKEMIIKGDFDDQVMSHQIENWKYFPGKAISRHEAKFLGNVN
jgi:hypothetical protein